jgi:hypothetical protein
MNMVQHSGSSEQGGGVFDFSTPTAVMAILKTLRAQAEVEASVRNEIRDQIFAYTSSGGKDDASRQVIEARLRAVGITPESIGQAIETANSASDSKPSAPKAGFSVGRVAPTFTGSFAPTPQAVKKANELLKKSPTVSPVVETLVPPPQPPVAVEELKPLPTPTPPPPVNKIVPTIPVTPIPTAIPVVEPMLLAEEKKPVAQTNVPREATVNPPSVPEVSSTGLDTVELLERIRVIKADINARVGNPVNLVAINSTIGREYMSSLLEAMKQLGSGNPSSITTAMKRLEIAYEQALSVIEMPEEENPNSMPPQAIVPPTPPAMPTPVPTQPQSIPVVPVVNPPPVPSTYPTSSISSAPPVTQIPSAMPAPVVTPEPKPGPVAPVPVQMKAVEPTTTSYTNPPLGVTRAATTTPAKLPTTIPVTASPVEISQTTEPPAPVPIHSSKLAPAKSVAMATPLRKVEELPTLAEVKNRTELGNPLYAQEISEGLVQLLSEWTIFSKSGIFGTGPRGIDHPLYKKLAPLKIPLIISGRFEGATEEVRQSITDYMNGWRYEQGIIYEKDETFEIYLRRVIRHIIDSQ